MMADEEKKPRVEHRPYFEHRAMGKHGELVGVPGVNHVRIAARDRADLFWFWSGPEPGWNKGIAKTERTCRQKWLRALPFRLHQHLQRPALHFFGIAGVHKMTRRQDQRPRGEDLRLPLVRKAQIDSGCTHRGAS